VGSLARLFDDLCPTVGARASPLLLGDHVAVVVALVLGFEGPNAMQAVVRFEAATWAVQATPATKANWDRSTQGSF
jgi:hypothetical protein